MGYSIVEYNLKIHYHIDGPYSTYKYFMVFRLQLKKHELYLSRCLIHQIEDAVIGNAGVLAEPHFTGAAVAESLTAIPGDLSGQAGERGGVELRGHQPLVAGKAAALNMLRDYHLTGAGAG